MRVFGGKEGKLENNKTIRLRNKGSCDRRERLLLGWLIQAIVLKDPRRGYYIEGVHFTYIPHSLHVNRYSQ